MVHRVKFPTPIVKLDYVSLKPETHTVEMEQQLHGEARSLLTSTDKL